MISSKRSRCTCTDPHAYWDSCGVLCPEYCGQLAKPICSPTCNPGCHCASGYVKARNHVMAPCVLRTQCFQSGSMLISKIFVKFYSKNIKAQNFDFNLQFTKLIFILNLHLYFILIVTL